MKGRSCRCVLADLVFAVNYKTFDSSLLFNLFNNAQKIRLRNNIKSRGKNRHLVYNAERVVVFPFRYYVLMIIATARRCCLNCFVDFAEQRLSFRRRVLLQSIEPVVTARQAKDDEDNQYYFVCHDDQHDAVREKHLYKIERRVEFAMEPPASVANASSYDAQSFDRHRQNEREQHRQRILPRLVQHEFRKQKYQTAPILAETDAETCGFRFDKKKKNTVQNVAGRISTNEIEKPTPQKQKQKQKTTKEKFY